MSFACLLLFNFLYSLTMNTSILKFVPLAFFMSFLTACGGDKPTEETTKADQTTSPSTNTIKVAVEAPYPPFVQLDSKGGFEGFDVDLLNEIGKREGFQIAIQVHSWDGIFDLLETNEADVIASGVFDTPERASKYSLSIPYHAETMVLVAGKDSLINSFNDAKGKRVAYVPSSLGETILLQLEGGKELDPALAKTGSWPVIQSVMNKSADLAIDNSSAYAYYAKQYPDQGLRAIMQDNPAWENVVFAVKKDNNELLTKLNNGITAVKADGTYDKIKSKWFGNTAIATGN